MDKDDETPLRTGHDDRLACHCHGQTRSEFCRDIDQLSLQTAAEVEHCLLASARCRPNVEEILASRLQAVTAPRSKKSRFKERRHGKGNCAGI